MNRDVHKILLLRRDIWRSFVKEKLANQKERQLVVRGVNTTRKYFGMVIGSGDVPVRTRVLIRKEV